MLGLLLAAGSPAGLAAGYQDAVLADEPLFYIPMGRVAPVEAVARNSGTSANAVPDGVHHAVSFGTAGPLPGTPANVAGYYDGTARTIFPHSETLNPSPDDSFTIEFWANPAFEADGDTPSPVSNLQEDENGNLRGWAFFQLPAGQGWSFNMYGGNSAFPTVNLTGGTSPAAGWRHIAATWQGATQTVTLYVNGIFAGSNSSAFYEATTAGELILGASSAGEENANPFRGRIDEVAFYPAALSGTQIADHYALGVNPAPLFSYPEVVKQKSPDLYLRQNDIPPTRSAAVNLGTIGREADGLHFPGLHHQVHGALAGSDDTAAGYHTIVKNTSDGNYATALPFHPEMNTEVFTIEGWFRPTLTGNENAQCPIYNHNPGSGVRSGWVFWQRSPSQGWNFRAYNTLASNPREAIDVTFGPYTIGEWQHVVVTFDGSRAVCYINGQEVAARDVNGTYNPNRFVPGQPLISPGIGGFPNGWENGFEGDIDEVAFYGSVLTSAEVAEHYANATNPDRAVPYEELILSRSPAAYYRLNEPGKEKAANLGTLGPDADAVFVNAPGTTPAPDNGGFSETDAGSVFDGATTYVDLFNPPGLNFSGPITLEAWVQPASVPQTGFHNIISHGHAQGGAEVSLRIQNGAYAIGINTTPENSVRASFPIPPEDREAGTWVHLAGTWDGTTWTLYRNGDSVATFASTSGPQVIQNANWAVGARGRWERGAGYPNAPVDDPRIFNGAILAPAIFNKALTREQILAHYTARKELMSLDISRPDGVITLTWEGGVLQESDNLVDWNDVIIGDSPATSPYLPDDGPRHFYRLRADD